MNPEQSIEARLESLEASVEETNKILRSMRRSQRIGRAFTIFYWVVVIGIAVGAFYFIRPYVDSVNNTISDIDQFKEQVVNDFSSSVQDSFKR